ncbi:hypothetical protein [Acinetobacter baumannii]|uniref:hypothetical protein n=1 Tax=Acinetobacter baumannii TaxID=470 RepID=UPI0007074007|nr:hypothetical protein [Acinetobacter baumannii]KQK46570.1 hypothetical protein AQ482_07195 [Acinetobacter baumannii]MDP7763266.1 hypothetical protein [Acinetobacter baumannii]TPU27380.1 hypothetical protein FJU43_19985 [Acinetobacter baumannii]
MKRITLLLTVLGFTSISFANEPAQKIDFDKITSQQLSDVTNFCSNNDYKSETCQQLKKWQDERRERMVKEAQNTVKYS